MESVNSIPQIVTKHLQAIQQGIVANMEAMKRNASGRSVASLKVEAGRNASGEASAFLTGGQQWLYMQRGRGPGKVPYNFAEIIREWIVKKGLSLASVPGKTQERKLTSLSYMIANSIMKKGTTLHRNSGYNDIFDTLVAKEMEKLADEAAGVIAVEYDKINQEYEND